jgi:putative chitinase
MISVEELAKATKANIKRAAIFHPHLVKAMEDYYIYLTPERTMMFLANVGHESGYLNYTTEIWGPTPTQSRYEGREDLGNTQPGDGSKYRGHGLFQTTGRYNHANVRDRLRLKYPDLEVPDFEEFPEKLAEPMWAAYSAADFCDREKLNAIADTGNFDHYCDEINRGRVTAKVGDSNGYADRLALFTSGMDSLA